MIKSTGNLPAAENSLSTIADLTTGKQIETGNPLDLAIVGSGYFTLAGPNGPLYSRQGQFTRDADGRLVSTQGFALQAAGGDLVLGRGPFEVTADGIVLQDGAPIARLAIAEIKDAGAISYDSSGLFRAAEEAVAKASGAAVRQGALESSNVSPAQEMESLMMSVRRAETGQRIIGAYDDLMSRALSAFGQE